MSDWDEQKPSRILVVDPDAAVRERFRTILGRWCPPGRTSSDKHDGAENQQPHPYELVAVQHGAEGFAKVVKARQDGHPYALAFINHQPPTQLDNIETTRRIWEADPDIQVVIRTTSQNDAIRNLVRLLGTSHRLLILKEPFHDEEVELLAGSLTEKWRFVCDLASTVANQNEQIQDSARVLEIIQRCEKELESSHDDLQARTAALSTQLSERVDEILGTRGVTIEALTRIAGSRDAETGEHLARLRGYSQILADHLAVAGPFTKEIDERFLEDFLLSTPLHDIGKVGVPDSILRKPGRLDAAEFETMKQHTTIGAEALEAVAEKSAYGGFLQMAAAIARWHHEWYDGTGYPDGLAGTDIPLCARIVAVADVFDALTSRRVYKDKMPPEEAKTIILQEKGSHFDPHVLDAFCAKFMDFLHICETQSESPTPELLTPCHA